MRRRSWRVRWRLILPPASTLNVARSILALNDELDSFWPRPSALRSPMIGLPPVTSKASTVTVSPLGSVDRSETRTKGMPGSVCSLMFASASDCFGAGPVRELTLPGARMICAVTATLYCVRARLPPFGTFVCMLNS
jgi:hypothetical protein